MFKQEWTQEEDRVMTKIINLFPKETPGTEIAKFIEEIRPAAIKDIRYEGSALYQHVNWLRRF